MANIKFNIISKNNPSNLNIRFYHGKEIDCNAKSNILINPKFWSNKMQNLKPSVDKKFKNHYIEKIENLHTEIILKFNEDYSSGKIIDSKWLNSLIDKYYNRPKDEDDVTSYFIPFIKKFIEESKNRVNPKTGKKNIYKNYSKIQYYFKEN